MENVIIGSHVSYKKDSGLVGSVKEALSYGANTFMIYTGAPQNTVRVSIDKKLVEEAYKIMEENGINPKDVVVHAPYIINLASADAEKFNFAVSFLKQELKRTEEMGFDKIVLHPGSHVGAGEENGIQNIISGLNLVLKGDTDVDICLETMAGKGSELGKSFDELKKIIDGVEDNSHLKVCLDTCHINDAGYDLSDFDEVLNEFDKKIGLEKLAVLHINDSKNEKGAHKDRHENLGLGTIGFDKLLKAIYNPKLKDIPKILETPYVSEIDGQKDRSFPPYKFEIEMIKSKKFNDNLLEDIRNDYK